MAMVVGDRRGSVVALTLAATLGGCLEGPSSDATSSSTSTGSVESTGTDTTGTSSTSIESSSGADTGTTATAGSSTTDVGPTCNDGQQNGAETDVDCGGGCLACDVGQACLVAADCKTGLCDAGVCQTPECTGDGDCSPLTTACAKGTCDKQSNTCTTTPINEGNACDDGDLCTTSDTCKSGACVAGPAVDCTEFDSPCTVGKCDPNSGSCGSYDQPDGTACDDGDGCTFNEQCTQGACVAPAGEGAIFYDAFSSPAGIRRQPYSTYVGTYSTVTGAEVHNDGEIYAGAMWRLYELFQANNIPVSTLYRLFVDGMNYTPATPAYENMRDGMLQSDAVRFAGANKCLIWSAFAQSGIGVGAQGRVVNGAVQITESFALPVGCP